jgi:hypothetical protein
MCHYHLHHLQSYEGHVISRLDADETTLYLYTGSASWCITERRTPPSPSRRTWSAISSASSRTRGRGSHTSAYTRLLLLLVPSRFFFFCRIVMYLRHDITHSVTPTCTIRPPPKSSQLPILFCLLFYNSSSEMTVSILLVDLIEFLFTLNITLPPYTYASPPHPSG